MVCQHPRDHVNDVSMPGLKERTLINSFRNYQGPTGKQGDQCYSGWWTSYSSCKKGKFLDPWRTTVVHKCNKGWWTWLSTLWMKASTDLPGGNARLVWEQLMDEYTPKIALKKPELIWERPSEEQQWRPRGCFGSDISKTCAQSSSRWAWKYQMKILMSLFQTI